MVNNSWNYCSGIPGYLPDYSALDGGDDVSFLSWEEARAGLLDWIETCRKDDEDILHAQGESEEDIDAYSEVYQDLVSELLVLPPETPWTGYGPKGGMYFSLDAL